MKKHAFGSLVKSLAVVGALVGAAIVVLKRSELKADPWDEAYWQDVTPAQAS